MSDGLILAFEDEWGPAQRLADACGWPLAQIHRHRFPDGEVKLRLPPVVPTQAVVFRGLHQPNDKLIELLLVAQTARSLGATHLALVCPYLAYRRQDIAFAPGEAVSQRIVGTFLAQLFDTVVTVDPHLHRVACLHEAVPATTAVAISGAPALADWVARQCPSAIFLGPDEESAQWVSQAAARHGHASAVCRKVRHGDHDVAVVLPDLAWRGASVVILDDVLSTGHTVAKAAQQLWAAGVASVDVAVTHALFSGEAESLLHRSGVGRVWSTDTVAHPTNVVCMAADLAAALLRSLPAPG